MNLSVRAKLSIMMFLELFIWGAWLPQIFGYLGPEGLNFNPLQQALVLNAFAIGSITALFFSNQFADRNFSSEKFLAFSHLAGGVAIMALAWVSNFWPFFWLMLIHSLFYVPTLSIANSIAFANLKDGKDFPRVRLWGTIGWIAAAWPFIFIMVDWHKVPAFGQVSFIDWLSAALSNAKGAAEANQAKTYTFIVSGIASLLLAAFSLTLPHTPPKPAKGGVESFAWLEAMRLLKVPFIFVLFLVTFIDAAVLQCYFIWTETYLVKTVGIATQWVQPVMSIGQIAEIGTMAVLGFFLKALGWRTTMFIGIMGHVVRFAIFAFFPEPMPAILVNMLHGVCYAFFFATVYIFVDEFFPKDARTSAQGLFNFLILGMGPLVGNFVWPALGPVFQTANGGVDFQRLFLIPAGTALFAAVLLLLFFHPPAKGNPESEEEAAKRKVYA